MATLSWKTLKMNCAVIEITTSLARLSASASGSDHTVVWAARPL